MEPQNAHIFRFGPFCLEIEDRLLLEHGRAVPLTPKAFDTLVALVRRNGRVVKKEDLLSEVWPNTFVEEATLAQNVFTLRKALGQTAGGAQYIETIPKHGYRFVADVEEISGDDAELLFQTTTRTHIVSEELEHSDAPNTHITESPYRSSVVSPEPRFESISHSFPRDAITGEVPPQPSGRHLQPWLTLAIIPVLALVAVSYWRFKKPESNPVSQIFSNGNIKLSKVTSSGTIKEAAISRDGKYVSYVQVDREGQSLWVKQASSSRAIKITEPGDIKYQGLTFTPDGTSIYYAVYEKTSINGIVYEVPTLGGASRKVSFDVDSPPSFAPDGKRFAFVRNEAGFKESSLIISEADTGREKKLVSIPGYAPFSMEGPAWSPDGKAIVIPTHIGEANRSKWILLAFDPETGEKVPFESHEWDAIGQTAWLPEGRGLVFVGRDKPNSLFLNQLWQISFPGGQAQMITNDLNTYTGVAVAFSPPSLLTIQSDRVANFYLAPKNNLEKPVQVTSGRGDKPSEVMGLSWTPDNKIVYGSSASGNIQIWMMDPDGNNAKQITSDPFINLKPVVSPDGKTIVYVSRKGGAPHIWKMDIDGRNPVQLTNGNAETFPSLSPDGSTIVYSMYREGTMTNWKVSIDGGAPEKVSDEPIMFPTFSPDGKVLAGLMHEKDATGIQLVITPAEGGKPSKIINLPPSIFIDAGIKWAPDGQSVHFVDVRNGSSNIWAQPIEGGGPRQISNFDSGYIFRFGWSRDGQEIAMEHGIVINDVVLITNFM